MIRWRALANTALAWSLQPPCAVCDAPLDRPLEGAVCEACWRAVVAIRPPVCHICGDPVPSIASGLGGAPFSAEQVPYALRCRACRSSGPRAVVDRARAVGEYDGTLRTIIHALKYSRRLSIVPRLAALMCSNGHDVLADADAVVPVPLHPRRRRRRGFNQAELLARRLGLPVMHALRRVAHTAPQVTLSAAARRTNVDGAFALAAPSLRTRLGARLQTRPSVNPSKKGLSVHGAVLVLVDDVTTTGATLDACARVLKGAGAREVRALTAARVVAASRRE